MREIMAIDVVLDECLDVEGHSGKACMILFHGTCDCDLFHGRILPGGADTQKEKSGELRTLSARYILEGTDAEGNACRIFIENNGAVQKNGQITTKPVIYTDSKALIWLEQADLTGHVQPAENGVRIIFEM
ncbi:MAG: DUF3237 family protein [Butyrivibrio sp.]|nr:DUF3237 family protein [Butyrivibrio sp.]